MLVSLVAYGVHDPACGQDPVPIESERVDARVEEREGLAATEFIALPREDRETVEPSGLDLALVVAAAYEDNIFLSATDRESDLVIKVAPRVGLRAGQKGEEGAHVRIVYVPTAVLYADHGGESRIDHDLEVEAGLQGKRSGVSYRGGVRRRGDATADTGTLTDRTEFSNEVRVAWSPREKLAVELAAGAGETRYDSSALFDNEERFGEVALRYAYSPKTQVVFAYRAGRFEVDGGGRQTFRQAVARVAWQPRQKISLQLEAGVEHRDFIIGSDVNPVLEGRLDWEIREGTTLYLTGYRREEASAFFPGQNYGLSGLTGGVAQRLGDGWSVRLEGGYERASYKRISGTGPAGREDRIYFIRPSLEYAVTDHFQWGLFYEYSRNHSNQPGFGYEAQQVGVRAVSEF